MARMLGRYRRLIACGRTSCRHCAEDGAARWRKRIERRLTDQEIDGMIAEWHDGAGQGLDLHEYLGWTREQYKTWVRDE
jgi:hypothetical protein